MSDRRSVWCLGQICEHREGTSIRRSLPLGERLSDAPRFFTTDHLGSLRDVTVESGATEARYEYDPWGRRTLTTGEDVSDTGYMGYQRQAELDLWSTRYRAYDSTVGNWLSSDPIGLLGGTNFYSFVKGNPINNLDPDGLATCTLQGSRVIFAFPLYFNKKLYKGPWQFARPFSFGGTPTEGLPDLGSLVECVWVRRVASEKKWRRMLLDTYKCQDDCGIEYTERRIRWDDVATVEWRDEVRRTMTLIPIVIDGFVSPEEACQRHARPSDRY